MWNIVLVYIKDILRENWKDTLHSFSSLQNIKKWKSRQGRNFPPTIRNFPSILGRYPMQKIEAHPWYIVLEFLEQIWKYVSCFYKNINIKHVNMKKKIIAATLTCKKLRHWSINWEVSRISFNFCLHVARCLIYSNPIVNLGILYLTLIFNTI